MVCQSGFHWVCIPLHTKFKIVLSSGFFTALSLLLFHHYSSLSPSQTSPYKTMLLALKVVSLFIQSSSLNSPSSANPSHVPHTSLTPALLSNTYIPLREWETLYLDTYLSFFSLSHLFLALCCVI